MNLIKNKRLISNPIQVFNHVLEEITIKEPKINIKKYHNFWKIKKKNIFITEVWAH